MCGVENMGGPELPYRICVPSRYPKRSGGQFNSTVEISTDFSTGFSTAFLVLQGVPNYYKNAVENPVENPVEISTVLLN